MPPNTGSSPSAADEAQRLLTLARQKGYAVTPDDVRRRFGRTPLTAQMILDAAATADQTPSLEVTAATTTAELDAFLFGD